MVGDFKLPKPCFELKKQERSERGRKGSSKPDKATTDEGVGVWCTCMFVSLCVCLYMYVIHGNRILHALIRGQCSPWPAYLNCKGYWPLIPSLLVLL